MELIPIDLPIPFVLGRMAYANKYPLDSNPFPFNFDDDKCLVEVIDTLARNCLVYDKAIKVINYVKSQPKYYQWLMGYRYQKLRNQISRQYDDMINKKFYNDASKLGN